jgi:hypothetical protein
MTYAVAVLISVVTAVVLTVLTIWLERPRDHRNKTPMAAWKKRPLVGCIVGALLTVVTYVVTYVVLLVMRAAGTHESAAIGLIMAIFFVLYLPTDLIFGILGFFGVGAPIARVAAGNAVIGALVGVFAYMCRSEY